jgi:hypothetical protein
MQSPVGALVKCRVENIQHVWNICGQYVQVSCSRDHRQRHNDDENIDMAKDQIRFNIVVKVERKKMSCIRYNHLRTMRTHSSARSYGRR